MKDKEFASVAVVEPEAFVGMESEEKTADITPDDIAVQVYNVIWFS